MQNRFVGKGGDGPSDGIVCKGGMGVPDGFNFNTPHTETGFACVNI